MPAMLILMTSMSTLALRSSAMIAIPSLSLMLSSNTTSSGNRTLRLPGFCRAKTLALRDMAVSRPSATFANMQLQMCFFRLPAQADTRSQCLQKFCHRLRTLCSEVCVNRLVQSVSSCNLCTTAGLVGVVLSARWGVGWSQRCCKAGRAGLGKQGQ